MCGRVRAGSCLCVFCRRRCKLSLKFDCKFCVLSELVLVYPGKFSSSFRFSSQCKVGFLNFLCLSIIRPPITIHKRILGKIVDGFTLKSELYVCDLITAGHRIDPTWQAGSDLTGDSDSTYGNFQFTEGTTRSRAIDV